LNAVVLPTSAALAQHLNGVGAADRIDASRRAVLGQELGGGRRTSVDGSTNQAWDWGVEPRDQERSELELLRRSVVQLRTQLDQARDSLGTCGERQQEVSQALRQLDEARPWRRRRVRKALRDRQLL
jgi:hypothetical protein